MRVTKQSTARNVAVLMIGSADHITGLAGAALTITASKNGAAFAGTSPTVTDLGSGWYNLALTTTDTNTIGDLALHITATSADPQDLLIQVVAYDPTSATNLGLSNLDAASSTLATASAQTLIKAKTDQLTFTTANKVDSTIQAAADLAQAAADKVWSTTTRQLTGTQAFNLTGSITGSLSGAVGSVTGNVGGNVVGSVASVTARVTANADQLAGQTVTAGAGVTFPTSVASPTNITAGTITTVTNLTNAATAGDLTATMKTSVTTAATAATPVAASVTGAVGSVTGAVGSIASAGISTASFAVAAIDATVLASSAEQAIADKTLATAVEGTLTLKQALQIIAAATAGKVTGGGTTTITMRNTADSVNAIVATCDANGNRSALTYTFT